jgi:hypothetical protein
MMRRLREDDENTHVWMGDEVIAATPSEPDEPPPLISRVPETPAPPAAPKRSGGGFDWAAALAAFSRNPALLDKALGRKAERRKEARDNEAHGLNVEEKRGAIARQKGEDDRMARFRDPNDPKAQRMRNELVFGLDLVGSQLGMSPEKIAQMKSVFEGASVEDMVSAGQRMGENFDIIRKAGADKAAAAEKATDNARADAQLGETARHNRAMEAKENGKAGGGLRLFVDQNKLIGEMAKDVLVKGQIEDLTAQIDKWFEASGGKDPRKTGPISGRKKSLEQTMNETADPEWATWASNLTRLFSEERKTFAGVAVTPQEMENLKPMLPNLKSDSEVEIRAKLQAAKEWLDERETTNMARLQFDATGKPIDRSLLAQMIGEQAKASVGADPTMQKMAGKTPAPSAPQSKQLSDEDKQAIEWAKANRGNPDADAILALHGVK